MSLIGDMLRRGDATTPTPEVRPKPSNMNRVKGKNERLRDVKNSYDAAALSRRSQHWRTAALSLDANSEIAQANSILRGIARDLVRNNSYASRAKSIIGNNVVGAGIIPRIQSPARIKKIINQHFDTTAIDADGLHNLYGLQSLAMKAVVESGEVLIRRRPRRVEDGLPLPFQIQVMESDYLDSGRDAVLANGGMIINGIEFDAIGRRVAYWIFPYHPGSVLTGSNIVLASQRVDAANIAHIFRMDRPGQMRGVTWFAPVITRLRDFADFSDAQLVRQKIAACFAAFVTKQDGGINLEEATPYPVDTFEPGMIEYLRDGESVTFANPPSTADYQSYTSVTLHEIAAGLGITYEAMAGDLSQVNFSSARMGWLEFQRNIDSWRWLMLIPQFLDRLETWTNESISATNGLVSNVKMTWTPPRREMIDPTNEIASSKAAIRSGLTSRSEEIRRFGFDPEELDAEIAADNDRVDQLKLIFETDTRLTTEQGQLQGKAVPKPPAPKAPAPAQAEPAPPNNPNTSSGN